MSLLKDFLSLFSGNYVFQRIVEKNMDISEYLMGVAAGDKVDSSGEKKVVRRLKKRSGGPYCIFDVGANIGQYAAMLEKYLNGESYNIHCFEPSASAFGSLSASVGDNPYIVLNNFALGRDACTATLFADQEGSGLGSLTKRRLDHFNIDFDHTEEVTVHTVDEYCDKNGIDHIDLLKIDVEGHEIDVLKGATGLFKNNKIGMATFEFGGCHIDTRSFLQDFYYFFEDFGMTLHRITPTGYLFPLKKYKEIDEQFRTTNFVAFKR